MAGLCATHQTLPRRNKRYRRMRRKNRPARKNRGKRKAWNSWHIASDPYSRESRMPRMFIILAVGVAFCAACGEARAQRLFPSIFPEARDIQVRDPSEISRYLPPVTP